MQNLRLKPLSMLGKFRGNIESVSTYNLLCRKLSVGKLQLLAPPTFLAHEAAGHPVPKSVM